MKPIAESNNFIVLDNYIEIEKKKAHIKAKMN